MLPIQRVIRSAGAGIVAALFSATSTNADAHWNLDTSYWEQRKQPDPIPANLRERATTGTPTRNVVYYTNAVRVLGYHDVFVEPNVSPTSDVTPDMFQEHMLFMKRAGYNVVTMKQVNDLITSGVPVPPNAVAITFDDDYRGQYWHAFPVLRDLNFPATYYVHSGFVGVLTSKDHSTWQELAEMMTYGHDVQSHTVNHVNLSQQSQPTLDNELINSRNTIQTQLSKTVDQICYPFGGYNSTVIQRAQSAGYLYAQTTAGGLNVQGTPAYETKRNLLGIGDTLATFRNALGYTGTDPDGPIIADNTDASFSAGGFAATGGTGTHRAQYGTNYHGAAAVVGGAASATATWNATLPRTAAYDVSAWWPGAANAAIGQNTGATYRVSQGSRILTKSVDQTPASKGRWVRLGRMNLSSGSVTATLGNNVSSGTDVYADAIKFQPIDKPVISLLGGSTPITSGDTTPSSNDGTDFGTVQTFGGSVSRTFTITNNGIADLSLTGTLSLGGQDAASFQITQPSLSIVSPGQSATFQVTFLPTTAGSKAAAVQIPTNDSDVPLANFAIAGTAVPYKLDDPITTSVGWVPFGGSAPGLTTMEFDQSGTALLSIVETDTSSRLRVAGWRTSDINGMPTGAVPENHYVRALFSLFASGQTDRHQIPNLRLRVAQRFAVTSMLEVTHHTASDPEGDTLGQDLRPSSDPLAPSVYRLDFAPIRVPFVTERPSELIQRAVEAVASEPQEQGTISLTESSITYIPVPASPVRVKDYTADNNDFTTAVTARIAIIPNSAGIGEFPLLDASAPQGVITYGAGQPITIDTRSARADRPVINTLDLVAGAAEDADRTLRARVLPDFDHVVRFHTTADVPSTSNAQIRLRARTAKFAWSAKLEVGGAWATGTDATVGNAAIATQALPGIGTQNPDRSPGDTQGGWYTLILPTPFQSAIRAELGNLPLEELMPNLYAQDPPGINTGGLAKSRRDILLGVDIVDTLSPGPLAGEETGHIVVDQITIDQYPTP